MADRLTGILGTEQESPELETCEPPRGPDAAMWNYKAGQIRGGAECACTCLYTPLICSRLYDCRHPAVTILRVTVAPASSSGCPNRRGIRP